MAVTTKPSSRRLLEDLEVVKVEAVPLLVAVPAVPLDISDIALIWEAVLVLLESATV
jgi:hypothetical protein